MPVELSSVLAARPPLIRMMNEASLFGRLRAGGPLSRTELAEVSGLSKPTVSLALANLEQGGLIRRAGERAHSRGRAAQLFEVRLDAAYVLVLDVGRHHVRGALADLGLDVRAHSSQDVQAAASQNRVARLAELADELVAKAGIARDCIVQTVVGSPGIYDRRLGRMSMAWNVPGWGRPGVLEEIQLTFGESTVLGRDVDLAALAEQHSGACRTTENFAYIHVGTGIGMSLVIDGRTYRGVNGLAGEIGFVPLPHAGERRQGERRRGWLEAAASASGIVAAARRAGMTGPLTAARVFEAAQAGDQRAAQVVQDEAELVARGIGAVAAVADPELIVLGGGVGCAPGLAAAVEVALREMVPFAPAVVPSLLGADAVVQGGLVAAVGLAWDQLLARLHATVPRQRA